MILGRLNHRYRMATAHRRAFPDFIIVGAQKAGTSSVYYYLRQHPRLVPSYRKEIHFFDGGLDPNVDAYAKGVAWYRAHFPTVRQLGGDRKAFEASPLYLFNPLAPARIADSLEEVKLIAVLRDPVERTISNYFYERRAGREPLPIMEALAQEEARVRPALEAQDYKHPEFIHHSYKGRSLYDEQLKRYLKYFDRSSLLVMSSDLLFAKPSEALRRVFQFVGVDSGVAISDLKPRNIGTNKGRVEPQVYEYLQEFFRPHNERLYELVGEDCGW